MSRNVMRVKRWAFGALVDAVLLRRRIDRFSIQRVGGVFSAKVKGREDEKQERVYYCLSSFVRMCFYGRRSLLSRYSGGWELIKGFAPFGLEGGWGILTLERLNNEERSTIIRVWGTMPERRTFLQTFRHQLIDGMAVSDDRLLFNREGR